MTVISASAVSRGRSAKSTKPSTIHASSRAKRSSAYDDNFEQHLIDNNIYPMGYEYREAPSTPKPKNFDGLRWDLAAYRSFLSPSHFPKSAFLDFERKNRHRLE
ncbi:hypothetical protein CDD83_7516 [Cordyceps sp. RAO-2017]|nr:hypothetical protein CDD83_7516 [Cordyceps sp. RAO-2017]